MIRIFENKQHKLKVIKTDEIYFRAKDIALALGYTENNTNKAVMNHVYPEYKIEAGKLQAFQKLHPEQPQTIDLLPSIKKSMGFIS